jgi:hypothetical protein
MSSGDFGPLLFDAPTTEKPLLGSTEQWENFNFRADDHARAASGCSGHPDTVDGPDKLG